MMHRPSAVLARTWHRGCLLQSSAWKSTKQVLTGWIDSLGLANSAPFSLLDSIEFLSRTAGNRIKLPLRGILQGLELVATTVAVIFATAFLIGKSPLILFSGLGAMTVGDWLEMPKYGADGDVIDISLTTLKVRNWDKTITSVPGYALISDAFKNWRNIERVQGRRIKRAINIDAGSVRFASKDDLDRLRKARLLTDYIDETSSEIARFNQDRGVDPDSSISARRMTNLGLFRTYMTAYLHNQDKINHDLTTMVRQLEPGPYGIPIQIYGFANNTSFVPYENIQSDLFDHVLSRTARIRPASAPKPRQPRSGPPEPIERASRLTARLRLAQ